MSFIEYYLNLPVFGVVATFLPLVYGGVHLGACNFEFPTKTELLLWKIAGFDIMATVPVVNTILTICVVLELDLVVSLKFLPYPFFFVLHI